MNKEVMANHGGNGRSERLYRIEAIRETHATRQADLEQEYKRLLTSQIHLVDAQRKTEERLGTLTGNMNALIAIVDDIIRGKH